MSATLYDALSLVICPAFSLTSFKLLTFTRSLCHWTVYLVMFVVYHGF